MTTPIITGIIIFLIIQALLCGPVLESILNALFFRYIHFQWKSTGFILPVFYFYAKDIRLEFTGYNMSDLVHIEGERLSGWVNPLYLLIGRIRLNSVVMSGFKMRYLNRVSSYKKIRFLPKRGYFKIQNSKLENTEIFIEDQTMTPHYKLNLSNIHVEGLNMDVGTPIDLLFKSRKGSCRIASGELKTELFLKKTGLITLSGITWGELSGLKIIPIRLLENKVDLKAEFFHENSESMQVSGELARIPKELTEDDSQVNDRGNFPFHFNVAWNEYALPYDMAFRRLISQILKGILVRGVMSFAIKKVTRGIFELFRLRKDKES
ncbi:MAG: hypothetical protein IT569_01855 [Leptospiraceae bacterium]|nr:hypothetical protein [Leptospiraceae bacterium]